MRARFSHTPLALGISRGLLAGLIAGLYDALAGAVGQSADHALEIAMAGSVVWLAGLGGSLGMILTLVQAGQGELPVFASEPLDARSLERRAARLIDGLTALTLMIVMMEILPGAFEAAWDGGLRGAALSTGAAVCVGGLGLGISQIGRPWMITRAVKRLVRHQPLWRLTNRRRWATALGGLTALWTLLWLKGHHSFWGPVEPRSGLAALMALLVWYVSGPLLQRRLRRWSPWVTRGLLGVPLVAVGATQWMLTVPEINQTLEAGAPLSHLMLTWSRKPLDFDGDGYAALLGGGDCGEGDETIYPGADDVPGNGVDEDCDGQDLPPPFVAGPMQPDPVIKPTDLKTRPRAIYSGHPGGPWSVLLITVDSLRPDRMSLYGAERSTTPHLDALADRCAVFEQAYSASAHSPSALAALLSGRYPSEVSRNDRYFTRYWPRNVMLPEILKASGYQTAGFAAHWYFMPGESGLEQGFDTWQPLVRPAGEMEDVATARPMVERTAAWLDQQHQDNTWFAWVHLFDPHKHHLTHEGIPEFGEAPEDRYDHEIRYTDEWLGRLVQAVEAQPGADRTVIILTGNHGESFGEHGYTFDGAGLHEHQLRVPLMICVPGQHHRRVAARVSLVDLFPTVADFAALPLSDLKARLSLRGRSLWALVAGEDLSPAPIYAELPPGPDVPGQWTIIEGRWKLIVETRRGHEQLYDLKTDPQETRNLNRDEPRALSRLRNRATGFMKALDPVLPEE